MLKIAGCIAVIIIMQCSKKTADPCLKEWECEDCTCLFEKLQQNLHDPQTAQKIQECYNKVCK